MKIRARGVNHVKTASVAHLGCTRLIEQTRKNANFPVKIGVIRRASRWKTTSWRIGIAASSLQAGQRGSGKKTGDAAGEKAVDAKGPDSYHWADG